MQAHPSWVMFSFHGERTLTTVECFTAVYAHGVILAMPVPYAAQGAWEREARKVRKAAISSTAALAKNVLL